MILISLEPFHCLQKKSSVLFSSLKQFHWLIKIDKFGTFRKKFQKIWKKIKFYQNFAKIRDIKKLKTIPLPITTMQYHTLKPYRKLHGFWGKTNQKTNILGKLKNSKFYPKMLKFVILKSWNLVPWHHKQCSNLLSHPRRDSLALEARET